MKKGWSYKIKPDTSGYGPFICEIYFGENRLDPHYYCEDEKNAKELGDYCINWLEKLENDILPYQPEKWKNWLDWYSIAYDKYHKKDRHP